MSNRCTFKLIIVKSFFLLCFVPLAKQTPLCSICPITACQHKENDMGAKTQVNQTGKFSYYKIGMRLEMSIFMKLLLWSISSSLPNFASAIWVSTDSPPEGYQAEWPTQLQMGTNMSSVVLLRSPGGLWQLVCLVKPLIKHKQSIPH